MSLLLLDNYDSFTYNLLHALRELGADAEVHRNDKIDLAEVERFDRIVLSPGPGIPQEAGILLPLIRRYAPHKSIFGVCLGLQAIGEAFGGRLTNLANVYHGVCTDIRITRPDPLFAGFGANCFGAGRYHSWIVSRDGLPDCLEVIAEDLKEKQIMALRHLRYNVRGVQFHPESILTPQGKLIIANWLNIPAQ
ncbi:MAG: aminodeoxychorismate/anthranilate synthase component II [Tannerellaceae bacterium]|jgi:anthranilate synthase component 2|nr:aminodeoxychorismate/anthranilate synthase component II [Tannerellaceae bacterium]